MKSKLHYVFIPLIIFILSQILFLTNFWIFLEKRAEDVLFVLRGSKPISNEIVIIAMDDDTFSSLDMRWPFPRELYGRMTAGARQIIFDIEFTESSHLDDDLALISAAEDFGNVIFAGKMIKDSRRNYDLVQLIKPIPLIRERGFNWGLVNISPDIDGFIRRYTLFEEYGNELFYPIGIASLANLHDYYQDWKEYVRVEPDRLYLTHKSIPRVRGNQALIQYYGPPETFTHYSFSSVIDDSEFDLPGIPADFQFNEFYHLLEREVFKDKIVLVGATVDELHDTFNTPFSENKLMSGVEIHANFMEMVNQEDYLKTFPSIQYLIVLLITSFLFYFIFIQLKPVLTLLLTFILIAAYLALGYYLFAFNNIIITLIQMPLLLAMIYLSALIQHYIKTTKEKKQIKKTFMHYMAPELVNELLKHPKNLKYGGAQREVTVLFSDIRAFTTYSEKHSPQETVSILQEYLTEMVDLIISNKGILDKFVGDEIMALYGAPVPIENAPLAACKTALEMRHKLTEMQAKWKAEGRDIFEIGIGINTGLAVVGNLGSQQIFDYTAIGDTINLGARLEAINKEYQTQNNIIISEFTLDKVKDFIEVKYLDEVKVKGKDESVKIYELLHLKKGIDATLPEIVDKKKESSPIEEEKPDS